MWETTAAFSFVPPGASMATLAEQEQALLDSLSKPQSASNDAGSVSMPSLFNVDTIIRRLKSEEAAEAGNLRPKFSRFKMGGTYPK